MRDKRGYYKFVRLSTGKLENWLFLNVSGRI